MEDLSVQELSAFAGDEEAAIGDAILGTLAGIGVGVAVVGAGLLTGGAAWVVLGGAVLGGAGGYLSGDGKL